MRPLACTPALWSLVFPLGMYALASLRPSLAADFRRSRFSLSLVMRGLVPRIPLRRVRCPPCRDGRDKPGHDAKKLYTLKILV